jgi:hypothetical protein
MKRYVTILTLGLALALTACASRPVPTASDGTTWPLDGGTPPRWDGPPPWSPDASPWPGLLDGPSPRDGYVWPDISPPPPPPPDAGPPGLPSPSCLTAPVITLVNGKGSASGNTSGGANDFGAAIKCLRFASYTTTMDGPQAYFKFSGVKGQLYRITTSASFSSYTYVFTSGCTAAAISGDCTSNGKTGVVSTSAPANKPEPIYFSPPHSGDVYLAVDSTYVSYAGGVSVTVEAIPTPTNTTCAKASFVPLVGGKATILGDLDAVIAPDEFSTLSCGTSFSALDGPNRYYAFIAKAGKAYTITLTPLSYATMRMYYVTTPSCSAAAIQQDCQSGGVKGDGLSYSATPTSPRSLAFSPSVTGVVKVVVDDFAPTNHGQFKLEIQESAAQLNQICSKAQPLTLGGGKVTVKSNTLLSKDEHASLRCRRAGSSSTTSTLDGPQLYYSWAVTKDQWYRLTLKALETTQYLYVFTGACNAAAIETSCQSSDASGGAVGGVAKGDTRALYFKAPSTGVARFAVDSTSQGGAFEATVEAMAKPTNGSCSGAKALALVGGKASVKGDVGPFLTPDEHATLLCGSSSSALNGPQAYHALTLTANQPYLVTLTADAASGLYAYLFGQSCLQASIQQDCQSGGATGDITTSAAYPGDTEFFVFTPSKSGAYTIGVDSRAPTYFGAYTLQVETFTAATNDTCQTAQPVKLTAGKATVSGTKTAQATNALLKCGSTTLSATDLFYRFAPAAGKTYRITYKPQGNGGRFAVWDGNHGCVAASVEAACGVLGSSFVSGGGTGNKMITASGSEIYIVADGLTSSYNLYTFVLEIEPLP